MHGISHGPTPVSHSWHSIKVAERIELIFSILATTYATTCYDETSRVSRKQGYFPLELPSKILILKILPQPLSVVNSRRSPIQVLTWLNSKELCSCNKHGYHYAKPSNSVQYKVLLHFGVRWHPAAWTWCVLTPSVGWWCCGFLTYTDLSMAAHITNGKQLYYTDRPIYVTGLIINASHISKQSCGSRDTTLYQNFFC